MERLRGYLTYCLVVSMFSGDLDDNRILWLWAGITMAVCRNAYLESRRRSVLNLYRLDAVSQVAEINATNSNFVHPQTLKG